MKKLLVLLLLAMACSPDLILGPDSNTPVFPPIDRQTRSNYCIAGELIPPISESGSVITFRECTRIQAWRLRVKESDNFLFDLSANFNWAIALYQVNVTEDDGPYAKYTSVFPALVQDTVAFTYPLEQLKEYAVVVVGRTPGDVGSYRLQIE